MNRLRFGLATFAVAFVAYRGRCAALAATVAQSAGSFAQRVVASFDKIYSGPHAGYRANHAKGIVCEGTFAPSTAARELSVAPHFKAPVKATVRFSNFGGSPTVPDGEAGASPHGCAVKFHLPGGDETDLVGHSVPFFPAATPEDFNSFLQALAGGAATAGPYLATHPAAAQFAAAPKPPPVSFATASYYFIDAFAFVDATGKKRFVRYTMRAVAPEASLDPKAAAAMDPGYLAHELTERLERGPVEFDYVAQIANDGDPTHDPTQYWPADRKRVTLGRLTIASVADDNAARQQRLLFDPTRLPAGIELTDDPLPIARSQAYAISYARRYTGSHAS